jgi:hypothetical protein
MPSIAGIDYRQIGREYRADRRRHLAEFSQALESGELKAEEVSFRGLYAAYAGPYELEKLNPRSKAGYHPAEEAGIAVFSSDFANTIGQLMYSRMMEGYNNVDLWLTSQIPVESTPFLDGERIPGMRNLAGGGLEVPEGMDFPTASFADDYIETPATKKYGLKVEITKEAVWADRTGLAMDRAYQAGEVIAMDKEDRLWDIVLGVTNNYKWRGTTYNTYQTATPWINAATSSTLDDYTALNEVEQLWINMTDPDTLRPIALNPSRVHLLVPPTLWATAAFILNGGVMERGPVTSSNDTVVNRFTGNVPYRRNGYQLHDDVRMALRLAAGSLAAGTWLAGDLSKAFAYSQAWGLQVLRAPRLSPAEFDRDIMVQVRADERGVAYVKNPRYMIRLTPA